jgi:hypothetical protein
MEYVLSQRVEVKPGERGGGIRSPTASGGVFKNRSLATLGMTCFRVDCRLERKFFDLGRGLVEVAVTEPGREDYEVGDSRPSQARGAVGPGGEIDMLVMLEVYTL